MRPNLKKTAEAGPTRSPGDRFGTWGDEYARNIDRDGERRPRGPENVFDSKKIPGLGRVGLLSPEKRLTEKNLLCHGEKTVNTIIGEVFPVKQLRGSGEGRLPINEITKWTQ